MHQVTSKTRDRLIFSAIIFVLVIAMIAVAYISPVALMAVLVILAGLKLGDFIVSIAGWLIDWLDETW